MARPPYEHDEDWTIADLELIDGEEDLPWLESGEDEDAEGGYATSRLVLLGVLSLVVVGAIVAAAWLALGSSGDEPPADGSVIAAPEEPYKTKPEDAGGKTYAGTGDTSFAVGEGQTREGQLAEPAPVASQAADKPEDVAGPSLATTLNEGERTPDRPGTYVQVGAFPKWSDAQDAWGRLTRQTEALNGVRHRVVQAKVDIGTVYRLQAVTSSNAEARALCGRLKNDGLACFVK